MLQRSLMLSVILNRSCAIRWIAPISLLDIYVPEYSYLPCSIGSDTHRKKIKVLSHEYPCGISILSPLVISIRFTNEGFNCCPSAYTLLASIREPVILAPLMLPLASTLNEPFSFWISVPINLPPRSVPPIYADIVDKLSTFNLSADIELACIILFVMIFPSIRVSPVI